LGLYAIQKIARALPIAYANGNDMEARTEMCAAANLAGIAFSDTDVHFGHCVADGLSLVFHTPHGYNCALATPEVLKASAEALPDKVRLIGEALNVSFTGRESDAEIGEKTAEAVRELMRKVGIVSLKASGKTKDETLKGVPIALAGPPKTNAPFEVTEELAAGIFAGVYDNYQ
jgi:alcohol dehydrogenase class IV